MEGRCWGQKRCFNTCSIVHVEEQRERLLDISDVALCFLTHLFQSICLLGRYSHSSTNYLVFAQRLREGTRVRSESRSDYPFRVLTTSKKVAREKTSRMLPTQLRCSTSLSQRPEWSMAYINWFTSSCQYTNAHSRPSSISTDCQLRRQGPSITTTKMSQINGGLDFNYPGRNKILYQEQNEVGYVDGDGNAVFNDA